jgi:hypothetical protein
MRMVLCGIVMIVGMVLAGCSGQWAGSAASNYEVSELGLSWSPDPNGGVGVLAVTDSVIPDAGHRNIALGPALDFNLGSAAGMAVDAVTPGSWRPLADAPVELFGELALLWDLDDGSLLFLPGTSLRFLPDSPVRPIIRTQYLAPEGSASEQENLYVLFGAMYEF